VDWRRRRRTADELLLLPFALALIATPPAVRVQPTGKIYRIGYLAAGWGSGAAYLRPLEAFRQGLRELGWVEGHTVRIEYRFAEGRLERLPGLAEELVRLNVDVIAASPTPASLAAAPRGRSPSSA
jgi:putative ABC transport system substrate-binding protein